jgi:hypothetical protein
MCVECRHQLAVMHWAVTSHAISGHQQSANLPQNYLQERIQIGAKSSQTEVLHVLGSQDLTRLLLLSDGTSNELVCALEGSVYLLTPD